MLQEKTKFKRSSLSHPLQVVEAELLNALYNEIKLKQNLKPMKNYFTRSSKFLLLSPVYRPENT